MSGGGGRGKGAWRPIRWGKTRLLISVAPALRKKIKYFMLEPSIFGVKTSPSMENTEPKNKILLSSTNF